jgi:hypothetical protein
MTMNDEKLPIKFFAKRDIDILQNEPGGNNNPPKWILGEEELMRRSQDYIDIFKEFEKQLLEKEQNDSLLPLVFKAKIIDDAMAKTHRREICKLFRTKDSGSNVLGLSAAKEIIVKVETSKEASGIINRLKNAKIYNHAISSIDNIDIFYPTVTKSSESNPVNYKVKLIDFQNWEQNNVIRRYFENSIVKKLGLEIKKTNYTTEHILYKIKSVSSDALISIEKDEIFGAIFSIEPMPIYSVGLDSFSDDDVKVNITEPDESKHYVTVGILDSGIAPIPYLNPWITDRHEIYPEIYMDKRHGTFTAGVIGYGDLLEDQEWVGSGGVKMLDACVFPSSHETIEEDELIKNIQEVVEKYHKEVKIWNLSISVAREVDEFNFSDFAIALDGLQDEYGVLICKSAGNCDNFKKGRPKGKIHVGADSVRSIVVGSIAHKKSQYDFVEVGNPSPFSRVGRGPSFIIKPEIVHYGGNAGIDDNGNIKISGVKSFSTDGTISKQVGTSFSTPRVTALAAGLYQEMGEEFDPLLIKGLLIHSSSYSHVLQIPDTERVNQVGFGKPKRMKEILYNSPNEVTLILRDELSKGEFIDIMDFPMPECLIEGDYYQGQIIVTLIYNPILDPSQRSEYCQSNIDVKMGTFDDKASRDTNKRNILNPVGRDGSKNLLLETFYSKSKRNKNEGDFALKERLLIQYGDKYYPVKKYAVDLSELTDSNRVNLLTKDKKWFLCIKGLFREHIETKSSIEFTNLSQEFCLLVTIRDPSESGKTYNQTTQKLIEHNFWHSNIKLRSDIELKL